uniref:Putative secreted protein n=1 Tax=Amblyomma triste TaxID=251400 RepID=A0A023G0P7_AMBTT
MMIVAVPFLATCMCSCPSRCHWMAFRCSFLELCHWLSVVYHFCSHLYIWCRCYSQYALPTHNPLFVAFYLMC